MVGIEPAESVPKDRDWEAQIDRWIPIFNEAGNYAERLLSSSLEIEGPTSDPRVVSTQLFKRLVDHLRAFSLLWPKRLAVDSELVLRAAIEATICLANLERNPQKFLDALRSDAAFTIRGQIPAWGSVDAALAEDAATVTSNTFGQRRDDGSKHSSLKMKDLAAESSLEQLYGWHKHLSGTSAHVTGISLMNDAIEPDDEASWFKLKYVRYLRRSQAISHMCGVLVIGGRSHAVTIGDHGAQALATKIMATMTAAGDLDLEFLDSIEAELGR